MTESVSHVRTTALMGTVVRIEVIGQPRTDAERERRDVAVERAVEWFRAVECCCSRFDPNSEVRRLAGRVVEEMPVSAMLAGTMRFALALAEETSGAFDPTMGQLMEERGDNVEYRSRLPVAGTTTQSEPATWRDVLVHPQRHLITLRKPMVLDVGAIAKGLAVDLAARELQPLGNFAIDAGGDLYLSGTNATRELWRVGIRHPRADDEVIQTLRVSGAAVCTSGDYERAHTAAGDGEHHLLDPRNHQSATGVISATVVAPTAMVADGLATAAFVLGPREGIALLERHGVDGLIVASTLERHMSTGMRSYFVDSAE
ncbi:MAG: FAD:protein FMN transferase [Gemmatimonadota bacterium]|nr:FAD:protein FMN transferase [Gemmatimonadota bacterium]